MKDIWVQRFKELALPVLISEFKPERVIIFGSRITGNANKIIYLARYSNSKGLKYL